ncbi:SDR family oxidoreductase [Gammaproteobacteria bacterium]|nr:SDR family oxidoreductase [Gammaproteobacteria bacterium]MDA7856468.1 SDR family oxidoreductase [Gammaproteobacteria bacterium]MDA8696543.1 SDR family oxidoreductase [Gammaproteobacteria bacterium]MDA8856599.1 SDR family oxidoreductase [Gammaproteobacteria bacterium]MDA8957537.1 SDR family oxidoreductase [Gammaproteobacteria bacterium]
MSKTILITGAAKRIGKEIALTFSDMGWNIIIHYNSSKKDAEDLQSILNSANPNSAKIIQANLDIQEDVERLIHASKSFFSRIDVLVNNASAFYPTPIKNASTDDWDKLIGSNLKGPLFLIKGLHEMIASVNGSIINITDTNLTKGVADFSVYIAAKGGLQSITKGLARELAPNINVNAVAPGAMLEPPDVTWSDEKKASVIKNIPLKRMGSEKDIANTVKFLVNAKYITGQTIKVDGGRSLL